jgi:hypothetical protein
MNRSNANSAALAAALEMDPALTRRARRLWRRMGHTGCRVALNRAVYFVAQFAPGVRPHGSHQ